MAKAEALKDSISRAKDTENMLRLQADIRHADTERKAGERLAAIVVVAVLVATVLVVLSVYYRKRAWQGEKAACRDRETCRQIQATHRRA